MPSSRQPTPAITLADEEELTALLATKDDAAQVKEGLKDTFFGRVEDNYLHKLVAGTHTVSGGMVVLSQAWS